MTDQRVKRVPAGASGGRGFAREMQVKQYVSVVQNRWGQRFRVFCTGDDKFYLFDPLIPGGDCSGCIAFPVRKANLTREIASALRHGWGNA